jgi:hypothetical protein
MEMKFEQGPNMQDTEEAAKQTELEPTYNATVGPLGRAAEGDDPTFQNKDAEQAYLEDKDKVAAAYGMTSQELDAFMQNERTTNIAQARMLLDLDRLAPEYGMTRTGLRRHMEERGWSTDVEFARKELYKERLTKEYGTWLTHEMHDDAPEEALSAYIESRGLVDADMDEVYAKLQEETSTAAAEPRKAA